MVGFVKDEVIVSDTTRDARSDASLKITATLVTFNDAAADQDFVVKGDTDADLIRCDASTDRVGISTPTPAALRYTNPKTR